jgi:hypothetical protein
VAGIVGRKEVNDGLRSWLMGLEKGMNADVQEAALEAGIRGQAMMEHAIDTTESSLSPGKMNRNWTFNMRNSLDSKVARKGTTISVETGWLTNRETYFLLQEHGADLVNGSKVTVITPMNALIAGHEEMLKTLSRWGVKVQ